MQISVTLNDQEISEAIIQYITVKHNSFGNVSADNLKVIAGKGNAGPTAVIDLTTVVGGEVAPVEEPVKEAPKAAAKPGDTKVVAGGNNIIEEEEDEDDAFAPVMDSLEEGAPEPMKDDDDDDDMLFADGI